MSWSKLSVGLGLAVVAVFLTELVTRNHKLMWFLLPVAGALIAWPYVIDWQYGKDRPTREQINRMSAAEYKQRIRDPKFKRYDDWLSRKEKRSQKPFNPDDW
jgi:hypothetical protein